MKPLKTAWVITALLFGCGAAHKPYASNPPDVTDSEKPVTSEAARAFFEQVETDLKRLFTARDTMNYVNMTYITDDTETLAAQGEERVMAYLGQAIEKAKRFENLDLPPELARERLLLKLAATVPAPADATKRAELASLLTSMASLYGKGAYCPPKLKGKCLDLQDLSKIFKESRNYDELLEAWKGWHDTGKQIRDKFTHYVELGNEGAREIGFSDLGEYWRSGYDMPPNAFSTDIERLWAQVKPLYEELHCYVRSRLRKRYGKDKIAERAMIPAHLLGNMWAQEWADIYPLVEPYPGQVSLDVTRRLVQQKYDETKLVKLAEASFTSLGMDPLPQTFWTRSMFKKPRDRNVVCHASAWDVAYDDDLRIKMCIKIDEEDLITLHHELGHDYYFHYYHTLPVLFQAGANDGFHEGIGDTLALSITPVYLKSIGLADSIPNNPKADINQQLKMALDKVAFLPFGKVIDEWRWKVFSGAIPKGQYNQAWWDLRRDYEGIAPPVARTEEDFDPGAKYHVPGNTPYIRYFLARIYQFQFHRALCRIAGHQGPLSTCSIYGNKAVGEKLIEMLKMGASRPWPDALEALSGERQADAQAMLDYFAPLHAWLQERNKVEMCGWPPAVGH